jgi:glycosyltransferase involved in cell wall biosynthesis
MSAVVEPMTGSEPGPPAQEVSTRGLPSAGDRGAKRRVLIIVQNLSVPLDRRVWQECRALTGAGYGVSVICPRGPGEASFEVLEGVRIHRYTPPPVAKGFAGYAGEFAYCWLRTAALSLKVARQEGFDAIQACNPPDTYWALALPYKATGTRFVFDQHDLNPEVYASRFGKAQGPLYKGLLALERATYKVADHVISTNESYRNVALTRGGRRPDGVSVVRSGPDVTTMVRGEPVPELRKGRKHLLAYLGIMGPQDGVDGVLHAMRRLVDAGRDDAHLAMLGFGDCLDDLKALATELRLDDYVTFTGRVGPTEIRDYLSTAAVGLSPDPLSPLNDVSTMNKTLEYMAFELPVVAFDLKETQVSAGDAAVYVRDGDFDGYAAAISELLDDEERRREMGRVGRKRIEDEFSWQHQAPRYVEVFRSLLGDPEPAEPAAAAPAAGRGRGTRLRLATTSLFHGRAQ